MKVGLIDVDGHNYPNLPLMKLSAYHKKQGDNVEWYDPFSSYDIVYKSKVFSFTQDYGYIINADKVISGGTGYAMTGGCNYCKSKDDNLSEEVEHIYPDYSLYGITDTAYGFLTRGCPRGCSFCIVGKKEGMCSRKVADLKEFWNGQKKIVLNDPNILACSEWDDLLGQLSQSKATVDFNQGLDVRLLTEKKCEALNKIKMKEVRFAWDNYHDKDRIIPKLKMFADWCRIHKHNRVVYVLTNYNTTTEQDLERIYTLRDMGYFAYVMIYDKKNAPPITKSIQRWCNNRFIFSKCERFEDYNNIIKEDKRQMKFEL